MSGGSNFRRWRSYNKSCQHPSGSRQSLITTPGTRSSIMTRACPRPPTNCRFQLECPKISFKEAWSSRVGRSARTRTVVSVPLITTSNRLFCDTIPCNPHATPDSPWQKPPRTSTGCAKLLGTLSHAVGQRSRGVVTAAGSFPRGRSAGEAKGGITGIPADKLPTWSKALAENAGASAFSRTLHPRPNVSCARPFAAATAACVCSCHSNSASAPLIETLGNWKSPDLLRCHPCTDMRGADDGPAPWLSPNQPALVSIGHYPIREWIALALTASLRLTPAHTVALSSRFGMRGEETPYKVVSRDADRAVEARVVWDLVGIVHGLRIPGVDSADELADSHFGVGEAVGRAFLGDGGEIRVVAQACCRVRMWRSRYWRPNSLRTRDYEPSLVRC